MSEYTPPPIYQLVGTPTEPAKYTCLCNWCTIRTVTPENRCYIPLPVKDIVYGNCESSDRRLRKYGYFCQWSCALAFCTYRTTLQHLVHLVRIEAGRHGYIGIIPIAPDPMAVLTRYNPSIPSSRKETETQFQKHIDHGIQIVEQHFSAISSARVHHLHLQKAHGNGVRVLESQNIHQPDLSEQHTTTEKITTVANSEETVHNAGVLISETIEEKESSPVVKKRHRKPTIQNKESGQILQFRFKPMF